MKKMLAVLVGVFSILFAVFAGLLWRGRSLFAAPFEIPVTTFTLPDSEEALARGAHLVATHCAECHGEDLGGSAFVDDGAFARLPAPNLTSGQGGVGGAYEVRDWVRAIRHGVAASGHVLMIMPCDAYARFSEADLGAIVAHLQRLPPVDREWPARRIGPMGAVLLATGQLQKIRSAETMDHDAPFAPAVEVGETAEYGRYLVETVGCQHCHGSALTGGEHPGKPGVLGPDLTRGGTLAAWDRELFLLQCRTRASLDMPWKSLARMTDEELGAIWAYLESLEPSSKAGRKS